MNVSTLEALTGHGGGLPAPGASITITEHQDGRVTVSTWNACLGVSAFVAAFLGEPAARATTTVPAAPSCCRCDPERCVADDSGDHCMTAGCARCLEGCPATEGTPCCEGGHG